jgi:serine/threonine protein kinase
LNPRTFGRFEIQRKLPAGGMGRVYEALDPTNSRRVALKLIERGSDPDSMQVVAAERLGVELHKRLCALDPRVTAVYEFGETPDFLYIVMEYVDGRDLSELAAQEQLGHLFAARIAQDVLEVLDQAHRFRTTIEGREYQGIVHGDIKPRNIRLTTVGQTKVLDFGIAKAISMTRNYTSNMFGSTMYSSPERLKTGDVTVSSDLWAVAVVLYEMIARKPYFEAETQSKLEHMIRSYRTLRPIPENCPVPLQQILTRALSPYPEERYQTAADFTADLRAFRSDQPLAVVMDMEATRRTDLRLTEEDNTATIANESEVTRRTDREAAAAQPVTPSRQTDKSKKEEKRSGPRWGRVFGILFGLLFLYIAFVVFQEWRVWQDARALAHGLESERIQKVDAAWDQYQTIANRARTGVSLWTAQSALRNRLIADADRVINEYRVSDAPTVTENEWLRARQSLARAMELLPRDKVIRGKLRLVDGHIARIKGTARRDAKMLQDSREKFTESADLLGRQPDPWLGLSRLYFYSLRDVEHGEQALREAEKRGHEIGKRETAMLADGYRDRAERTLKEAVQAANRPEQDRYLERARKDFDRARELYESIIPWAGAAANLRKTYDGLDRIEDLRARPGQDDE